MTARSRGLRPGLVVAFVLLALVAGGLESASLPHVHAAPEVGLWNLEHDLAYLAALGNVAPLAEGPVALRPGPVDAAATPGVAPPSAAAFCGAEPRGPPAPSA
jgi:hypothetical protein